MLRAAEPASRFSLIRLEGRLRGPVPDDTVRWLLLRRKLLALHVARCRGSAAGVASARAGVQGSVADVQRVRVVAWRLVAEQVLLGGSITSSFHVSYYRCRYIYPPIADSNRALILPLFDWCTKIRLYFHGGAPKSTVFPPDVESELHVV